MDAPASPSAPQAATAAVTSKIEVLKIDSDDSVITTKENNNNYKCTTEIPVEPRKPNKCNTEIPVEPRKPPAQFERVRQPQPPRNDEGKNGGSGNDGAVPKSDVEYVPPYIPKQKETDKLFDSGIMSGDKFKNYEKIPVKVTGSDAPAAIGSFAESGLTTLLLDNVSRSHYGTPTPIQKAAIPVILARRDIMGCAQTGSGKTAAFLLPILHNVLVADARLSVGRPHVVIVSPTRELAIQVCF